MVTFLDAEVVQLVVYTKAYAKVMFMIKHITEVIQLCRYYIVQIAP